MRNVIQQLRRWTASLKTNLQTLYLASRHPKTPWLAHLIAVVTVAYALSPIDFIPDFIPVIGYLDDLLLVPLGLWVAIELIPPDVWQECREEAIRNPIKLPENRTAAAVIILIWLLIAALLLWLWLGPDSGSALPYA